ncbi:MULTISPECIES: metal ABC transporter ATP-binding protein [unclassified Corynebacterium]|uniref:metal ABC transporter ATP-binding protein n=1 Tax=unclassified Corynebacterium TaxID=2624378 RepID=UPI001EF503BE|nr:MULTISPECIES: metal ABC transporter ATP-binding protein [unclassified Corynebacterium]MCG7258568.1 metal ABC transporter ATP-binding protein [Corynebacterium sp. ACRQK]MCG7262736.1 metal ABC transporter ATP-binding protein [Corynebacterium sp. ACRQL]
MNSPHSSPSPALVVDNVHVSYGHVDALTGVNLQLGFGQITALIGMNGAGKSTLFKAIMGLVRPTSGSITVNATGSRGTVAYVPQHDHVDWNFPISVRDIVASGRRRARSKIGLLPQGSALWGLKSWRQEKRENNRIIDAALRQTGLTDLQNRPVGALSGGQRKRVFVARGIAQEAKIMLLDEPFAGVDTQSQSQITALLHELAEAGTALLISTHDLDRLPELCDNVAMLNRRIVAEGALEEVLTAENLARTFSTNTADAQLVASEEAQR